MLNNDLPITPPSHSRLRARFAVALRSAGAASDGTAAFDRIVAQYNEGHRHYHTLEHIDACLSWLDRLSASAEHPAEVELALWFHDLVYDPRRNDNEQLSAEIASAELDALGVPNATIERIASHILGTAQHIANGGDAALVIDIDLAILGANAHDFERFEQQIRLEYAHVVQGAYRIGRSGVLQSFLSRPQLYNTKLLADLIEPRARINLERRVAELQIGGEP